MDVMLDLETMDYRTSGVILTFGAIKFDPNSNAEPGDGIYFRLNVDEQFALGRTSDQSTLDWWAKQDPAVMEEAFNEEERISLEEFDKSLRKFLVGVDNIWAQGPTFDIVILEHLFEQMKVSVPWRFWQIRDSRTLFKVLGEPREKDRAGAHNALIDCYYQAKGVQQVLSELKYIKEIA